MENLIDKRAFNEIKEIINHLEPALQIKIPDNVINFIEEHQDDEYVYEYDENKEIDEQKMLEDTEILLSLLYRDYICTDEEKKELEEIWYKNELEYQKLLNEKYNTNNLFNNKNNPKDKEIKDEVALIKPKEKFWIKIIKKIKEKIKKLHK